MTNLFSYSKKKSSGSLNLFEESLCVLKKGNQKLLHSYSPIERKSVNGIIRISKQKASAAPYKHPKQKRKRERESDIYKIYSIITDLLQIYRLSPRESATVRGGYLEE